VAFGASLHHLIITAHHIVCDGWSIDIVMRDIGAVYSAGLEGRSADLAPAQSIIDYAHAEVEWGRSDEATAARSYWLGQFQGDIPVLDLPVDHPRAAVRSVRGARADRVIPAALADRLRALGRAQGSTFVNLLLAAYKIYVARLAQVSDIVIGLPASGQAARGMPGVVGHCVNLLPIRTRIDWDKGFGNYLITVRRVMLDALDHQTYTYGELIRTLRIARDPSRVMLVPVIFNIDNGIDLSTMSFGPVSTEFVTNPRAYEHFELYLNVTDAPGDVRTEWSYNADLFEAGTIEGHIDRFVRLLTCLADDPGQPLGAISLLSPEDRQKLLVDWQGKKVTFPQQATLASLFADRVAKNPDAIALIEGETGLRYSQLDAMVGDLAAQLRKRGVGEGNIVGICMERSMRMVAALLAVMRLGAAYMPLDPSNPAERLRHILADSATPFVLTTQDLANRFGFIDPIIPEATGPQSALVTEVVPAEIAYIAYTSGSTGKPKGVMGTHRATINRFAWMWREFPFSPVDVMCQKTALSFVDSVWEIFGPLLAGVPQVIISNDKVRDPVAFLALLGKHHVTRLLVVPSLLKTILDAGIDLGAKAPSLRLLFTSGERIPASLARRMLQAAPQVELVNLYGSSEVAADVTCEVVRDLSTEEVPIGRALDNARIYVLDGARQLVPPGEAGELYVGGDVLAAGYLHRPDLTAERFVTDPFVPEPGARMFATGDRVQYLGDGRLIYLGRADHQVKIRGARVELGEVEAVLASQPAVAEAVAVARPDADGDLVLWAFVTLHQGADADPLMLRAGMAQSLPDYMVPSRIQVLDQMPLNPNGKTDRMALSLRPAEDQGNVPRTNWPVTATERDLRDIWARLLDQPEIGMEDDFFELGGHSLLAVKLFTQIRRSFGVDMPISTLFAHPTIRSLARKLGTTAEAPPGTSYSGTPEDSPWDTTTVIHPGPALARSALFIVGGVGGNVNNLIQLGRLLGVHRPVIGLQTRGILGHRMHDTIEAIAADHLTNIRRHQPQGPYLLAGYSGGAFTAFEMARQLRDAGEEVDFLGLLDTFAPKFALQKSGSMRDRLLYTTKLVLQHGPKPLWANFEAWMHNKTAAGAVAQAGVATQSEKFRYSHLARQWWKISSIYDPAPYDGDAWLFLTESDKDGFTATQMHKRDPLYGWPAVVQGNLRVSRHTSDHLSMLTGTAVQDLADMIEVEIMYAKQGV
jgi:amino acid adenylation domain-containing protein